MPAPCAVSACTNNRYTVKKNALEISFHAFPKHEPLRRSWIQFCNREENWEPSNNDVICSTHFQEKDFQMSRNVLFSDNLFGRKLFPNGKYICFLFCINIVSHLFYFQPFQQYIVLCQTRSFSWITKQIFMK